MRTFKNYLSYLAVFTLLITVSCNKDDPTVDNKLTPDKTSLSFATVLNDLVASQAIVKQNLEDLPACSPRVPSHVEVILSGTETVGTMAAPIVVNVSPNPGDYDGDGQVEYFTEEASELELDPGPYSLDFFAVYDSSNTLLWVAPASGSLMGNFVENPLPLDIDLAAGTKKYVDVDVLCFDDRVVNEYGYLFFDIENKKAIEFCFFANVCDDNGRHFPAHYSVDVWLGTDNTGKVLYSDKMNSVSEQGEDPSAAPLCLALPDLEEFEDSEDYIYYEVTLLDWANVYGDVDQVVKKGTLSRDDIEANFAADGTVDFEHLRFGCGDDENTNPVGLENFSNSYFYVIGADFSDDALPESNSRILDITSLRGDSTITAGGSNPIEITADGNVREVFIGLKNENGFFILPINTGNQRAAQRIRLRLMIGRTVQEDFTVAFAVSDGQGNVSAYEYLPVALMTEGTGL